jgi:hypothetical protein
MLQLRVIASVFTLACVATATAADSRPATPEEATLLVEALQKTAADMQRWAYTESRLMRDDKGKVKRDEVVRYDPSKPYAEQWTPISNNGKPPSQKELERARKRGEAAQKRDEKRELGVQPDNHISLGEAIEPQKARIIAADTPADVLVYEIPLRKTGNDRFPPEKFEVLARIDRATRTLQRIDVRLRDSFRVKLIAKVKSGDATLEFATIDPKHPPTLTGVRGDAQISILFVSVGGELEIKRTDLKHVKPFNERFDVQIGTLKAIDF